MKENNLTSSTDLEEKPIYGRCATDENNGKDGEAIMHRLDLMDIIVSTGVACDSKQTQVSHVLKSIELQEEYALGTIRISLCKDNTREDIIEIANGLHTIVSS